MRKMLCLLLSLAAPAACRAPTQHLDAANAVGPYSAAVATNDLVYLAGKIGVPAANFHDEVTNALDAVETDLQRLGLDLCDAVSVTVFLTDINQFAELNDLYAARFSKPYPARTTVAVAALPKSAHVELQVIARRR